MVKTKFMHISLIHYPVLALGPGKRAGIWTQGCSIRCPGCMSHHTWDFTKESGTSLASIKNSLKMFRTDGAEGLTLSGGEPFDQPEALHALLKSARKTGYNDILIYSGYKYDAIKDRHDKILELADVLIDGPFIHGEKTRSLWKGSENQRMVMLSNDAGIRRKYLSYMRRRGKRNIQVTEKDGGIFIIGITDQADTNALSSLFI
ncbi:MAG TPA: 4Fe-4S single cluster domain-containing protein [Candidatus Wallbacteria bacterium]|nr:4Fe-4S single cluster domain-containing protein [Candidatus Wallbacteria bacterium]